MKYNITVCNYSPSIIGWDDPSASIVEYSNLDEEEKDFLLDLSLKNGLYVLTNAISE